MNVPILDGRAAGHAMPPAAFVEELLASCAEWGCFYLADPLPDASTFAQVLDGARAFFALSPSDKRAVAIGRSPHYRGYSALQGAHDEREQMHFGRESAARSGGPDFSRLEGPNLWPERLGRAWRESMLAYLAAIDGIGRALLRHLARAMGMPLSAFAPAAYDRPYLLMKLLHYPAHAGRSRDTAMAAHCDFSFITLLLQDGTGLRARARSGDWVNAPSIAGTLLVTVGELADLTTSGAMAATPHAVASVSRAGRVSVPVFVNPDLRQTVRPWLLPPRRLAEPDPSPGPSSVVLGEHVHRVRSSGEPRLPLVFGPSEWARKGEGKWCYRTACTAVA